ncbi:hypothetical protein, partial [Pseudomonas sp. SIMBA_067]|uniref:hypothetical protein n=1 Tax=Pseudomonas sp. SIMBA_067 TaxID=3085807 RepID=UPI00397A3F56
MPVDPSTNFPDIARFPIMTAPIYAPTTSPRAFAQGTVHVVDDDELMCKGLTALLESIDLHVR